MLLIALLDSPLSSTLSSSLGTTLSSPLGLSSSGLSTSFSFADSILYSCCVCCLICACSNCLLICLIFACFSLSAMVPGAEKVLLIGCKGGSNPAFNDVWVILGLIVFLDGGPKDVFVVYCFRQSAQRLLSDKCVCLIQGICFRI